MNNKNIKLEAKPDFNAIGLRLAVGDVVQVKKVQGVFILETPYKDCIFSRLSE
jgi:hypothetical protein